LGTISKEEKKDWVVLINSIVK